MAPVIAQPKRSDRWLVPIFIFGALVAIACLGVYWVHWQTQLQQSQQSALVTQQAQQLDHADKYAQEETVLKDYISTNPPKKYSYPVLVQLGTLGINLQDYSDALKWYEQAAVANGGKPEIEVAVGLAVSEAKTGNKEAAISDYRQAIQLAGASEQNGLDTDTGIESYQEAIRRLGGTP
jgi:tetratricopeptide (TPR) repeat protein